MTDTERPPSAPGGPAAGPAAASRSSRRHRTGRATRGVPRPPFGAAAPAPLHPPRGSPAQEPAAGRLQPPEAPGHTDLEGRGGRTGTRRQLELAGEKAGGRASRPQHPPSATGTRPDRSPAAPLLTSYITRWHSEVTSCCLGHVTVVTQAARVGWLCLRRGGPVPSGGPALPIGPARPSVRRGPGRSRAGCGAPGGRSRRPRAGSP